MPTNYNFTNKLDYLSLKFPNISNSAQRLYLLGTQPFMQHDGGVPQPFAKCTISIQNLSPSELSPGKEKQALRITPTGTGELWRAIDLYGAVPPRPDNLDYVGNATRTYRVSFSYRSNSTGIGRTFHGLISDNFIGGGSNAFGGNAITTITDTNWHKKDIWYTWTYIGGWVGFGGFTNKFTTNEWTPSEWIDIADFTFTWDEQPTTTTSFDDQFIPADAFRQGNLWSWGNGGSGQLGYSDIKGRSSPSLVNLNQNWKQTSTGSSHSVAINTKGELFSTGSNSQGQIGRYGIGGQSNGFVREQTSSTNWTQVRGLGNSTAAIKTDGTLWTWGQNSNGQLGINDNIIRSSPVQEFSSSTNWKQVGGGFTYGAAIKTDGTLWTWGQNSNGELGINDNISRSTPVQEFTSSTNWKQVSGGTNHIVAIKTDGTLWTWGKNSVGQLGINDSISRSIPVQEFTSSTNWKKSSGGPNHTAAIKTDGTLWNWGSGGFGELGINSVGSSRFTPVQEFSSSTNWKEVNCINSGTTAIKTNGTFWHWGSNSFTSPGGTFDLVTRPTPVQEFTSSTQWWKLQTGSSNSFIVMTKYIDPVI